MPLLGPTPRRMTPDEAKSAIDALRSRGAVLPCPRCGNTQFTLLDQIFSQPVVNELATTLAAAFVSRGPTIPSVVTACTRCGFLSHHALGVLGLIASLTGEADLAMPRPIESQRKESAQSAGNLPSSEGFGGTKG
jgi:hypothetical protein